MTVGFLSRILLHADGLVMFLFPSKEQVKVEFCMQYFTASLSDSNFFLSKHLTVCVVSSVIKTEFHAVSCETALV